MMQVKLRRTGMMLVGATSAVSLGQSAVGCAMATLDSAEQADTASSANAVEAGSATLSVQLMSWGDQQVTFTVEDATSDELLRVGESLRLRFRAYDFWWLAHPEGAEGYDDPARIKKLEVSATARFYRDGDDVGTSTVGIDSWNDPDYSYELMGTSSAFSIPEGTDLMTISFVVTDQADPAARGEIAEAGSQRLVVFGARPLNHILFDNDYGTLRQRLVEGGKLSAGRDVLLSFTDYRANTVVDSTQIDTKIGTQKNYGRFGADVVPMYGVLEHEVAVGVSFDDGSGWQELNLTKRLDSALVPSSRPWDRRFTFDRLLHIPASATKMLTYFHVKTYLRVDYSRYPNTIERYYQDGERKLVREVWDTLGGYGQDYAFEVGPDSLPAVVQKPADMRRTVVFVRSATSQGQDLFMRGGIDHDVASTLLGRTCVTENGAPSYDCAIPIVHRNRKNTHNEPWKGGDSFLDWYGTESSQSGAVDGVRAFGSPADWTTNYWPSEWGTERTVAVDGYGVTDLGQYCGEHCWMLDVDMDCSKAYKSPDGTAWFELKSFVSQGAGWEGKIQQAGDYYYGAGSAPYVTGNHFAKCGVINVFERGQSYVTYVPFPSQ